jgi:hypothetical protein
VLDVGRSRHAVDERRDVGRAADLVEIAERPSSSFSVTRSIASPRSTSLTILSKMRRCASRKNVVGVDDFGGEVEGFDVQQNRAEHRSLGFENVRKRAFGTGPHGKAKGLVL